MKEEKPTTPITFPWGNNINCKLDYIIQILLWQNEKICEIINKDDNCCEYLAPCDTPIEFIPPCEE